MNDTKKATQEENTLSGEAQKNEQELNVHNPFDKDDDKKITQEDIANEQISKEAQTERD